MQSATPPLLQLALRHWLLTTGLGFGLTYFYGLSIVSRNTSVHHNSYNILGIACAIALLGAVLGLLGIWWVQLIFGWAARTTRPQLAAGLGLLLTYLMGFGLAYNWADTPHGGSWTILLLLLVWCAASLLSLYWVPLSAAD